MKLAVSRKLADYIQAEPDWYGFLPGAPKGAWYVRKAGTFHWAEDFSTVSLRGAIWRFCRDNNLDLSLMDGGPHVLESNTHLLLEHSWLNSAEGLLPTATGIVDLRTGELIPVEDTGELYFTRCVPVLFNPQASSKLWKRFLAETFPDAELRSYVLKILAECLTGNVERKKIYFFCGGLYTGKTVLVEIMRYILGEFAWATSTTLLLSGATNNEIADLEGRRLAVSSELPQGGVLRDDQIKRWTGGGIQYGRQIYNTGRNFPASWQMVVEANFLPNVTGNDPALADRIRIVPFDHFVELADRDLHMLENLKDEAEGILASLIRGAVRYYADGMDDVPAKMRLATKNFEEDQDTFTRFVEGCCEVALGAKIKAAVLYEEYRKFCEQEGAIAMVQQKQFYAGLTAKGFPSHLTHGTRMFDGIRLQLDDIEEID